MRYISHHHLLSGFHKSLLICFRVPTPWPVYSGVSHQSEIFFLNVKSNHISFLLRTMQWLPILPSESQSPFKNWKALHGSLSPLLLTSSRHPQPCPWAHACGHPHCLLFPACARARPSRCSCCSPCLEHVLHSYVADLLISFRPSVLGLPRSL